MKTRTVLFRLNLSFRRFKSSNESRNPNEFLSKFERRHIGTYSEEDKNKMLSEIGVKSLDELITTTIPQTLHPTLESLKTDEKEQINNKSALTEKEAFDELVELGKLNKLHKNYIGLGYNDVIQPSVITRCFLNDPQVYTSYTPYQPEISQGRLELLMNFQTVITELTKLPLANSSLLDESSACVEALIAVLNEPKNRNKKKSVFVVDNKLYNSTLNCLNTRFGPRKDIELIIEDISKFDFDAFKDNKDFAGILVHYPNELGEIHDYTQIVKKVHLLNAHAIVSSDLMALTLLKSPGEMGFDIAVGSTQRFGVEMGFGGPYAGYFSCIEKFKRLIPGRIVGLSKDKNGNKAYRLALQTREQHIRRDKATSNICTAQALLANIAALYAMYHGPLGLRNIATEIHTKAYALYSLLKNKGINFRNGEYFDTIIVNNCDARKIVEKGWDNKINLRLINEKEVGISLNETTTLEDVLKVYELFDNKSDINEIRNHLIKIPVKIHKINNNLQRKDKFMTQEMFSSYHTETSMMRYIQTIKNKDISLANSMIPLGSCTMKLNGSIQMQALSVKQFTKMHPYSNRNQQEGYIKIIEDLRNDLSEITGMDATSIHPISGAQGEYLALTLIKRYYLDKNEKERQYCLIPTSAHGTNAASASITQFKIIPINCDKKTGYLDINDINDKIEKYGNKIGLIMITYPSTYGIFEPHIKEICKLIHDIGAQVYLDGANMNAQIGLLKPGLLGADVCHLNLHKTFCIPHGGGGPGVGPICVKSHLQKYIPDFEAQEITLSNTSNNILDYKTGQVNGAPYGSSSILLISWMYIKTMGMKGLQKASKHALLNANYMASKLQPHYKIMYKQNEKTKCAHEFILDLNEFAEIDIFPLDIAKRLQDYSFHSPTMSWPITNAIMIEPTESESKKEMDLFIDALIQIKKEINEIKNGDYSNQNNVIKNSPHTIHTISNDNWEFPYSRQKAAFPLDYLKISKVWPTVSRVDDTFGDTNLVCSCPPMESLIEK